MCEKGYYTDQPSQTCLKCNPGYVCAQGSVSPTPDVGRCPLGYYCDDSIDPKPCPAGKYGYNSTGITESEACKPCPPGYYCELATPGYPKYSVKCPPGHFCPESTATAFEHKCPAGTFNTRVGMDAESSCRDCEPGYYCQEGDPTGDTLCTAGHYCPSKTSVPIACSAGTYTEERGAIRKYIKIKFFYDFFFVIEFGYKIQLFSVKGTWSSERP